MYNRFLMKFVNSVTKFSSKVFIQRTQYKFSSLQCNFSVQTSALVTRGYCTKGLNKVVYENYENYYKEKLKELLENPECKTLYEKYKLEIEYLRNFSRVPNKLNAHHWYVLMQSPTQTQRRRFLEFLWKVEKKQENQLMKKELKSLEITEKYENYESTSPYGLFKCAMFHRIRTQTINKFYNSRLIRAILFEPAVVFDLGYCTRMTPFELFLCAKQLLLSFSVNRIHDQPFNLYFCNADRDTVLMQKLHTTMPELYNDDFPLNITSKSYLDVFDKKDLVYLTPHARETMTKFDPNAVYIIGALIDKVDPKPYSFQKAQKEGIRMMKFPLSQTLDWGCGSAKNLPLNQVLSILLDLRHTGSWYTAFDQHIPKRKLRECRERRLEYQINRRQKKIDELSQEKKKKL